MIPDGVSFVISTFVFIDSIISMLDFAITLLQNSLILISSFKRDAFSLKSSMIFFLNMELASLPDPSFAVDTPSPKAKRVISLFSSFITKNISSLNWFSSSYFFICISRKAFFSLFTPTLVLPRLFTFNFVFSTLYFSSMRYL